MPASRTHQDATGMGPRLLSSSPISPPQSSTSPKCPGVPQRPKNAWLCFRSDMIVKLGLTGSQTKISCDLAGPWNNLSEWERLPYTREADENKKKFDEEMEKFKEEMKKFKEKHPDYIYHPEPSKGKRRRRTSVEDGAASARQTATTLLHRHESQAYPAPTSGSGANLGWGGNNYPTSNGSNAPPAPYSNYPSPAALQYPLYPTGYRAVPQYPGPPTASSSYSAYTPAQASSSSSAYMQVQASSSYSAYTPAQSHYPATHAYQGQHYHQGSRNDALTNAELRALMERFNH